MYSKPKTYLAADAVVLHAAHAADDDEEDDAGSGHCHLPEQVLNQVGRVVVYHVATVRNDHWSLRISKKKNPQQTYVS